MTKPFNWKPSDKELRSFGAVILVGFGLIGALMLHKGHSVPAYWVWRVAGAVGALALIVPRAAVPFYWLWMGFGMAMGAVTSRIVLTLIFFLIFTPIAFLFRITKRDPLRRRKPEGLTTYWLQHPDVTPESYRHLS